MPSSVKHVFTLSQNQHSHNARHSTAYKLMVQKMHLGCMSKHHPNGCSNKKPFTAWHVYAQLIAHILGGFLIQIQTIPTRGLLWLILFFSPMYLWHCIFFQRVGYSYGDCTKVATSDLLINQYLWPVCQNSNWLHFTFSCRMTQIKL